MWKDVNANESQAKMPATAHASVVRTHAPMSPPASEIKKKRWGCGALKEKMRSMSKKTEISIKVFVDLMR